MGRSIGLQFVRNQPEAQDGIAEVFFLWKGVANDMNPWIIEISGKPYIDTPTHTIDEAQTAFKAAMADWPRMQAERQHLKSEKAQLKVIANRVWIERDQNAAQSDRLKVSYYRLWAEWYRLKMERDRLMADWYCRWAEWQESHGLAVVSRSGKLHLITWTEAGELLGPALEGW